MANPLYDKLFGRHAGKTTPFLNLPDGQVRCHDAFLRLVARLSHALVQAGLTPGDRLAAQIEKSEHALAVYAACVQSGIVFLPLNTAYTAAEVAYFVENSGAKILLCDSSNEPSLTPVANAAGALLKTLNANGGGTLAIDAAQQPEIFETVDRDIDDLAAFLYTSGTTGRSKGAMLTQGNLLSNAETLSRLLAVYRS